MEQLNMVLIVECCQRTKQIILRTVSPDNFENFNILRQDLLRTLFDVEPSHTFVPVKQLQARYEAL